MTDTVKPDLQILWAETGAVVQPSDAKIQQGWIAEKPPFQTENWVQNRTDQYLKHIDENGVPAWSATSSYASGSLSLHLGEIWQSLQDGNTGNIPTVDLGFWEKWEFVKIDGTSVINGNLVAANSFGLAVQDSNGDAQVLAQWGAGDTVLMGAVTDSGGLNTSVIIKQGGANRIVITATTLTFNGNTIWHSGNLTPPAANKTFTGKVTNNGSIVTVDYLPAGWTATFLTNVLTRITHNLGTTDYVPTIDTVTSTNPFTAMYSIDILANSFSIVSFRIPTPSNLNVIGIILVRR